MPIDPNDPQYIEAQNRIAAETHAREVDQIIEIGRNQFGAANFDDAADVVAKKLGPRSQEFMAIARQFDRPHEIVAHLANNESRLDQLSKLSTERQIIELGRIEAQFAPHGNVNTGADPLWKTPAVRSGRVSDEEWSRHAGEGLSERQWAREFDRRMAERSKRVR